MKATTEQQKANNNKFNTHARFLRSSGWSEKPPCTGVSTPFLVPISRRPCSRRHGAQNSRETKGRQNENRVTSNTHTPRSCLLQSARDPRQTGNHCCRTHTHKKKKPFHFSSNYCNEKSPATRWRESGPHPRQVTSSWSPP